MNSRQAISRFLAINFLLSLISGVTLLSIAPIAAIYLMIGGVASMILRAYDDDKIRSVEKRLSKVEDYAQSHELIDAQK
jgi:hypothetical protein